ncbi:hypothetical protein PROFUN_01514 [Planoprotostelium fungivorum]|uniref:CCZ1/INTU/HSP4 first Longin domain-containing protein n=1 Tax=Planoprotostelium fungivorum TaxID=1890364 RepID=A0A2P6NTG0_9EUKA|nr:hypothetical protein PROFUN_01514 [Planoprotostelium fungivorum]
MDNTGGKLQNLFMILDAVKDLKAEEATGKEVLYAYPAGETQQSKAGLFLGMRDIVWDFAAQAIRTVCFQSPEGQAVRVSYVIMRGCLLILMLPNIESDYLVEHVLDELFGFITFAFGDIEIVLRDAGDKPPALVTSVRHSLNRAVAKIFREISSENRLHLFFSTFVRGVPYRQTSQSVHEKLGLWMSSLEVSGRSDAELYMDDSRVCLPSGSVLFYQGVVVHSHLDLIDTKEVYRYCLYNDLIPIFSRPNQFEISRADGAANVSLSVYDVYSRGYVEVAENDHSMSIHQNKKYLAIVRSGSLVLCLLMKEWTPPDGQLDPWYTEALYDTIVKMSSDNEVVRSLEKMGSSTSISLLEEMPPESLPEESKRDKHPTPSSHSGIMHYFYYHENQGTMIVPMLHTGPDLAPLKACFYQTCLTMRNFLKNLLRLKLPGLRRDKEKNFAEYGVKLALEESFNSTTSYWVIGRMSEEWEFYVCHVDGVPINVVELAFKFRAGTFAR